MSMQDRRFAIIGAGMAGGSLGAALARRGLRVVAVTRRREGAAREVARLCGGALGTTDPAEAARQAGVIVLGVPDDTIQSICEQVARAGSVGEGDIVVHLSGALGADVLRAAEARGAQVLAFHPIQTFARVDGSLFQGVTCAIEGEGAAVAFGRELANVLGARAVEVPRGAKGLYHAALCLACNYAVTLADEARGLLEGIGFGQDALAALLPLLEGTVGNLRRVGLPGALTGPVSRGDSATIRMHLAALAAEAPQLLPVYRAVGLRTIEVGLRKGTLGPERARALRSLLGAEDIQAD